MDQKTVEKIAKLARIELTGDEISSFTTELGGIIKWVEQLSEVNTDAISDTTYSDETLRFRKDEVNDGNRKDDVLKNAPDAQFDCYVVPKVIE